MLHDRSRVASGQPWLTGLHLGGGCAQIPQSISDGPVCDRPAVAGTTLAGVADPVQAPGTVGSRLRFDLVAGGLAAGGAQPAPATGRDRPVDSRPGGAGDALRRAVD